MILILLLLLAAQWGIGNWLPVEHPFASVAKGAVRFVTIVLLLMVSVGLSIDFFRIGRRLTLSINHMIRARLGIKVGHAPDPYIQVLFDDYADQFESHLVDRLGYNVPEQMRKILAVMLDPNKQYKTLDLGCGTGLCAKHLKNLTDEMVGLDLSPAMLDKAQQTGLYSKLVCDSLLNMDKLFDQEFDLVVAADVLIYFGQLDAVFESVMNVLNPGGYFILSLEADEGESWTINQTGRYAHSAQYVCDLAENVGFILKEAKTDIQRWEADKPVLGEVYLFQRS